MRLLYPAFGVLRGSGIPCRWRRPSTAGPDSSWARLVPEGYSGQSRPETGRKRLVALRSSLSFRTTETRNRGGRTAQTGLGVVVLPVAASGAGDGDLSGRRGEGGLANVKVHDVPGQGRALFVVCACTFSHGTGGGWTFAEHNGQKEAFIPMAVSERELHSALSAFPEAAGFGLTRGVRLT